MDFISTGVLQDLGYPQAIAEQGDRSIDGLAYAILISESYIKAHIGAKDHAQSGRRPWQ